MSQFWTVQCGFAAYRAITVTIKADTLPQALDLAIGKANSSTSWKEVDHVGGSFVEAVSIGDDVDPWAPQNADKLEIPFEFTEAALWAADQPGYSAMRDALRTIAVGRGVRAGDHTVIKDLEDAMSVAAAALVAAGCAPPHGT